MEKETGIFASPYEAGSHAGLFGANMFNSHVMWFRTKSSTTQWEVGYKKGLAERKLSSEANVQERDATKMSSESEAGSIKK